MRWSNSAVGFFLFGKVVAKVLQESVFGVLHNAMGSAVLRSGMTTISAVQLYTASTWRQLDYGIRVEATTQLAADAIAFENRAHTTNKRHAECKLCVYWFMP